MDRYEANGLTIVQVIHIGDGYVRVIDTATDTFLTAGTWDEVQAGWRANWLDTDRLDLHVMAFTDVAPTCLDVDTDLPSGLIAVISGWVERNPAAARDWLNDRRHR